MKTKHGQCALFAAVCWSLVAVGQMQAGAKPDDLSRLFPLAYVRLNHAWQLKILADGSAVLQYGSSSGDRIEVPPNTFPTERRILDLAYAIEIAPPAPVEAVDPPAEYPEWKNETWNNAAITITRRNSAESKTTSHIAVFTPEIKAYVDRMLEVKLSDRMTERMKLLTNLVPVFSEKAMKSLTDWTNSPQFKARPSVPSAPAAVATPVAAKTRVIPGPVAAKLEPAMQSLASETTPVEAKDSSLGFRGWLVIVLLTIAAFLTYRFIRLRLGS